MPRTPVSVRARRLVASLCALLLAACASAPKAPLPPFVVNVAPTPGLAGGVAPSVAVVTVEDSRTPHVEDRRRIGEVYAPVGAPPIVPGAPAVTAGAQLLLLASPQPSGRYVLVRNDDGAPAVVEHALRNALVQAGQVGAQSMRIDATIRTFWMRPSWTTTCDVAVDVRAWH